MRLRNPKPATLHKIVKRKDSEGNVFTLFDEKGSNIEIETWPMKSELQFEMYGKRIHEMLNANYNGSIVIEEDDGILIGKLMYRVISIKTYTRHQVLELERA